MKYLLISALFLAGCASIPKTPCAKVCQEMQDRFNVPLKPGAPGHCLPYVVAVTPKLRAAGATNIRWVTMLNYGHYPGHIVVRFAEGGIEKIADNGRGPVKCVGKDSQEIIDRFMNPWGDSMCNVTLISDSPVK